MKTIPNLTFTLKVAPDSKDNATTVDLLKACLNQPPEGGFTFTAIRERNRIADAMAKVKRGGEIKLEDADHATARKCVEAFRWNSSHPDLLRFAEQFGL